MEFKMDGDKINQEILALFPQTGSDSEISLIKTDLYGFAKALIKAKLEIDGDENASKGREIQNNS